MKFITVLVYIFATLTLQAKEKQSHHHDHEAHVHGAATVNIAFDGLIGRIEFKAAAMGVVGFEHEAKLDKDKNRLAEVSEKFISNRNQIFNFEKSLECSIEKVTVGIELENISSKQKGKNKVQSEHADFTAVFNVTCKKSPLNSKLTFDFTQFAFLNDVDATILLGDLQKSAEIKKKPVTVDLK